MTQFASKNEGFSRMNLNSEDFANSMPTFDKSIESYFERNIDMIIEEWGLITGSDLDNLGKKIEFLSYEVGRLSAERSTMNIRVNKLKAEITELEGKL